MKLRSIIHVIMNLSYIASAPICTLIDLHNSWRYSGWIRLQYMLDLVLDCKITGGTYYQDDNVKLATHL